jgi:DNA-binding CsgD family transcriptional regulator
MSLSDAKVIELYSQGESCAAVARFDGCSETSMYNRLKSLRVKMRSRSEANQIFPDFLFISLYNIGLSSSQVGRLLGVDSSTVTKRLHTLKFPLRSRCVASRIRYTEKEFKRYFMVSNIIDQLIELAGG